MSRGPGRIERAIEDAFTAKPTGTFTTDELVALAYPGLNRVEKKHRVSVLRAADKVARRLWWQGCSSSAPGRGYVWLNGCDLKSYAVGKKRASCPNWSIESVEAETFNPARQYAKDIQPGGMDWTSVEINKLRRDNRHEEADTMSAELNAHYDRLLQQIDRVVLANSRR